MRQCRNGQRDGWGGKRDKRDNEERDITSEVDDGGEEQTLIVGQVAPGVKTTP